MKTEWNLSVLYDSITDPKYEADIKKLEEAFKETEEIVANADKMDDLTKAEKILKVSETKESLLIKLYNFISLLESTDSKNGDYMAQESRLDRLMSKSAANEVACDRLLAELPDVEALAAKSELVNTYKAYINRIKEKAKHFLSNEEEAVYSLMNMTGGSAWGSLHSFLTSTLKVDYEGKQVTLSEIRNLAYSPDAAVRKAAYEAEIAAYDKVKDSIAFALNNIKNQNREVGKKRNYTSPLDEALFKSKMSKATLDAMFSAIDDYLPDFRRYLKAKGKILGHNNGLPFYDLFAPLGKNDKKYSLEECKETLLTCFENLSPDMSALMKEAFENEWIDFYPRDGKVGGAFDCGLGNEIKQSRVLTNYDGSFSSVDTLAHELGHAFHDRQLANEATLNQDYPMPIAETASTFNETFLGAYMLKKATGDEEKLALLDSELIEQTQCMVDIYSRYLFETAVFEQTEDKFLMADDLSKIMLDAQDKTYGDGLDPEVKHQYMWVCKGHYYSSSLSFYNFPYAFGNLFAGGLYALFLKDGEKFFARYKEMLRLTPVHSIEEDGAELGIDLTKKEFWTASLETIKGEIDEFCEIVDKLSK